MEVGLIKRNVYAYNKRGKFMGNPCNEVNLGLAEISGALVKEFYYRLSSPRRAMDHPVFPYRYSWPLIAARAALKDRVSILVTKRLSAQVSRKPKRSLFTNGFRKRGISARGAPAKVREGGRNKTRRSREELFRFINRSVVSPNA